MKFKLFVVLLALVSFVCVGTFAYAQTLTDAQRQALIAQIQAQIAALTQELNQMIAQQQGTSSWCYNFTKNLGFANSGDPDVGALHTVLDKFGISYAPDTGNDYSDPTALAVKTWQGDEGIYPATGYIGTQSLSKLGTYSCSNVVTTPIVNTNLPAGCNSTSGYSTTTGLSCSGVVATTNCTATYNTICSGNNLYYKDSCGNTTTVAQTCSNGCSGGQCLVATVNTNLPAGCNSTSGYSTTTGLSCSSTGSVIIGTSSCKAFCTTQQGTNLAVAVGCDGTTIEQVCDTGEVCSPEYNISNNLVNGVAVQTKTLTDAQCGSPVQILQSITYSPAILNLVVGGSSQTLPSPKILGSNGQTMYAPSGIAYFSDNTSIATVDNYGSVTPTSTGAGGVSHITASVLNSNNLKVTSNSVTVNVTVTAQSTCSASDVCVTTGGTTYSMNCAKTYATPCSSTQKCVPTTSVTYPVVNGLPTTVTTITGSSCVTQTTTTTTTTTTDTTGTITSIRLIPSASSINVGDTVTMTAMDQNGNDITSSVQWTCSGALDSTCKGKYIGNVYGNGNGYVTGKLKTDSSIAAMVTVNVNGYNQPCFGITGGTVCNDLTGLFGVCCTAPDKYCVSNRCASVLPPACGALYQQSVGGSYARGTYCSNGGTCVEKYDSNAMGTSVYSCVLPSNPAGPCANNPTGTVCGSLCCTSGKSCYNNRCASPNEVPTTTSCNVGYTKWTCTSFPGTNYVCSTTQAGVCCATDITNTATNTQNGINYMQCANPTK